MVLLMPTGRCIEVYLKEINFDTVHEHLPWDKKPEIFVSCDDSRPKIYLTKVKKPHVTYTYRQEELSITHIDDNNLCRNCQFKEEDYFTSDDNFGSVSYNLIDNNYI